MPIHYWQVHKNIYLYKQAPTSTSIQLNGRDTKVDDGLITRDVNEQKSFKDFAHKVEKAFGGIARDVNDDNGLVTRNAFKDFVHKIEGKVDAIKDLPSRVNE